MNRMHEIDVIKDGIQEVDAEIYFIQGVLTHKRQVKDFLINSLTKLTTLPKHPTVESIKIGQTIYIVTAHGERSWMDVVEVRSLPRKIKYSDSLFMLVKNPMFTTEQEESLKDSNIIPNTYNNHDSFYYKADAEDYLTYCKRYNIPSIKIR